MSHQGLKTLFERDLTIDRQQVILSGHPIFSLYWFVTRWADGLPPPERAQFLSMTCRVCPACAAVSRRLQ